MDLVADPCSLFPSSRPGFPRPLSIRFLVRQAREVRRPGSESTNLHAGSVRASLPRCAVEVSCVAEDHACLATGSVRAAHEFMQRLEFALRPDASTRVTMTSIRTALATPQEFHILHDFFSETRSRENPHFFAGSNWITSGSRNAFWGKRATFCQACSVPCDGSKPLLQSGRRIRAYALASARRSNCTCRFPAAFAKAQRRRDHREGIKSNNRTSSYSP
jgi:hypothetical protein